MCVGASEGGFLVGRVFSDARRLCKATPFDGMKIALNGQILHNKPYSARTASGCKKMFPLGATLIHNSTMLYYVVFNKCYVVHSGTE